MKRIVLFLMSTLTIVVLLFGYHTSTSSKAAGGETAFVSTALPGTSAVASTSGSSAVAPTTSNAVPATSTASTAAKSATPTTAPAAPTTSSSTTAATKAKSSSTPATTSKASTPATTATTSSASSRATTKTVTGAVTDTQWGPVQVQLTVVGGKITAVAVLQYPNGNGRDAEINANALPILIQETISAQSAKIDMVSGATVTSGGYLGSLQSALDQM